MKTADPQARMMTRISDSQSEDIMSGQLLTAGCDRLNLAGSVQDAETLILEKDIDKIIEILLDPSILVLT